MLLRPRTAPGGLPPRRERPSPPPPPRTQRGRWRRRRRPRRRRRGGGRRVASAASGGEPRRSAAARRAALPAGAAALHRPGRCRGGRCRGGGGLEADRAAEWRMLGGPGVAALLRRAEQLPLSGSVAAPTAGPKPPPPPPSSPKGLSDPAGAFSCGAVCGGLLQCGHHACTETCHPLAADAARPEADAGAEAVRRRWYGDACPLLPSPQLRCPCGARAADELALLAQRPPRSACTDPLPTCGGPCGKQLRCGAHACEEPCHLGPCPPCDALVRRECICGRTSREVPCTPAARPTCRNVCRRWLDCKRHRCEIECCADLSNPARALVHTCQRTCGRRIGPLGTGCAHRCDFPCGLAFLSSPAPLDAGGLVLR